MEHPDPHLAWLLQLTGIPTASGREQRVVRWIEEWVKLRPDIQIEPDPFGNIVIAFRAGDVSRPPLVVTAHLDHPAFVVERVVSPTVFEVSFRGGVLEPYFKNAPILIHREDGVRTGATIVESRQTEPFRVCLAESAKPDVLVRIGDIATWDLPGPVIEGDLLHAPACDDLAAVAAAISLMETLRGRSEGAHVRLLFTLAEEIGFVGAIGACKAQTIPQGCRVIALENSRSYAESPIGAGPIVRVGDRISTFSPTLTAAIGVVAERIAKVTAEEQGPPFRWQRRLMPGGACEASAFQAYGYDATCICLPLGNYHNMSDLTEVQAGNADSIESARCAREYISVSDYKGLVELLVSCAVSLQEAEPLINRMEKLFAERRFVLDPAKSGP